MAICKAMEYFYVCTHICVHVCVCCVFVCPLPNQVNTGCPQSLITLSF